MPEIIGIDHIYLAVSDLARSEQFYDVVLGVLGFRKNQFELAGEKHIQYYNRHFGYVLRPARSAAQHDSYAPGLHHFCLRVEGEKEVYEAARKLSAQGISIGEPKRHPEYAPDYYAVFLTDPDGIRLEITNYRQERRQRHDHWDNLDPEIGVDE
jgi:catechol 2,3-dioxygenase-like lactoylglutathione lyase family enzyme